VLADGTYPGLLRVAFLAHVMRYVLGVWLGWQPQRYQFSWHILTGPTQYFSGGLVVTSSNTSTRPILA
jgi:hypothetical protein